MISVSTTALTTKLPLFLTCVKSHTIPKVCVRLQDMVSTTADAVAG